MATKRELMAADDEAWALFLGTLESLSDEQLVEPGYYTEQVWSVKDLIAHVAFWQTEAANQLEEMRFGTYRPGSVDSEALNKECYDANRDIPLPLVRAQIFAAHTRMLQELDALPELNGEAVEWFAESSNIHYAQHQPRLNEWAAELRARAGA